MSENKVPVSQEIKRHLLTGISWMIPLIVAAGSVLPSASTRRHKRWRKNGHHPWMLNQIGGWGMGLIVPLISAAIAYSIADRPGFAPGLIVGFVCGQIHTGFIGGMLGGFLVGYTVLLLKHYIRLPKSMQGLMPIMVLPS
jgi:PTS system fructose-specific IIC component